MSYVSELFNTVDFVFLLITLVFFKADIILWVYDQHFIFYSKSYVKSSALCGVDIILTILAFQFFILRRPKYSTMLCYMMTTTIVASVSGVESAKEFIHGITSRDIPDQVSRRENAMNVLRYFGSLFMITTALTCYLGGPVSKEEDDSNVNTEELVATIEEKEVEVEEKEDAQ